MRLTISNALSHDLYYKMIQPQASAQKRVTISKILVLGIFWRRANKWGATLGMASGVGITFYYMAMTQPWLRKLFGVASPIADNLWFEIQPISAGIWGIALGFIVIIVVSLLTPPPDAQTQALVDRVRYPHLPGEGGKDSP